MCRGAGGVQHGVSGAYNTKEHWHKGLRTFLMAATPGVCNVRWHQAVPVRLNVYSLGKSESLERLNEMAKGRAAIVHTGLEVAGVEWSFGFTLAHQANSTGVFTNMAGKCRLHTYKWSHELGASTVAPAEIAAILGRLSTNPRWLGSKVW